MLIVGVAADATELKRTEQALKQALEDLQRANHHLEQMTLIDPLTGVGNRRFLDQFIDREWQRERRHGHPVSLVMVDIDHFKAYNDRYGHVQGDDCLRQVAHKPAERTQRPTDLVVRVGGEEFAVLLPETDLNGAQRLAEEMRKSVAELGIPHEESDAAPVVTVSAGVAEVDPRASQFDTLLRLADSALYRAKWEGRNRIESARLS